MIPFCLCITDLTDFIKLSADGLNFSVNFTNPSQTECFNISIEFGVVNICGYFDCSQIQIELNLVVLDDTPRVHVNTPGPTVSIKLPRQCEILCSPPDAPSNDNGVTIAAIILSIVVIITTAGIVVVSVLYFRRRNNNKKLDLEE